MLFIIDDIIIDFQFVGSFEDKNEKNKKTTTRNDNNKQARLDAQKLAKI
jgi:hypothetical protein